MVVFGLGIAALLWFTFHGIQFARWAIAHWEPSGKHPYRYKVVKPTTSGKSQEKMSKKQKKLDVVDDTQFRENSQLDGSPVRAAKKYPYVSIGEWSCN